MMVKRKANLDDGCNPELVAGAVFDGELEIPVIHIIIHIFPFFLYFSLVFNRSDSLYRKRDR